MRVVVCGGRDFTDVPRLWRLLDKLNAECRINCVIDGASDDLTGPHIGADYWAHQWALARNKPVIRVHADWRKHRRSAGPIRNQDMVDLKPDLCIAAPGGRGTAHMVARCRAAGIEVRELGNI